MVKLKNRYFQSFVFLLPKHNCFTSRIDILHPADQNVGLFASANHVVLFPPANHVELLALASHAVFFAVIRKLLSVSGFS